MFNNFDKNILYLKTFTQPQRCYITIPIIKSQKIPCELQFQDDGFFLTFSFSKYINQFKYGDVINVYINNKVFKFYNNVIKKYPNFLTTTEYLISCNNMIEGKWKNRGFYRSFIPTGTISLYKANRLFENFDSQQEFEFKVSNYIFNAVYYFSYGKNNDCFIFESTSIVPYEIFKRALYSFLISYGFLTSYLFQKNIFTFCSSNQFFLKNRLFFNPGTKNIFCNTSFLVYEPETIDPITKGKKLPITNSIVTREIFNNLFSRCFSSDEFFNAIYLFLEAANHSLDTRILSLYSFLEIIAKIITKEQEDNTEKEKPVKVFDRKQRKSINKLLLSYGFEQKNVDKMITKMQDVFRISSSKRFNNAFEVFNIQLNDIEDKLLNDRNNFFHGDARFSSNTIFLKKMFKLDLFEFDVPVCIICQISVILVLKLIGYDGYIKNSYYELKDMFSHLKHKNINFSKYITI